MEIVVETDNEIIILKPVGRLDAANTPSLTALVSKMRSKNYLFILLDLAKVNFIDSTGLGACISIYKTLNSVGGALVCAAGNADVSSIFHLTRADEKITIANSRLEALKILHDRLLYNAAGL